MTRTLDQIGLHHGTDKASAGYGYLDVYAERLPRGRDLALLEVGVFRGASLRTWVDWLGPDARVVGWTVGRVGCTPRMRS